MTMIRSESLGVTPPPPAAGVRYVLGSQGGLRPIPSPGISLVMKLFESNWQKYIWALDTKNIGSNIRRWQKTTQSSKQPVIMVGGVSQASVCQPQTIIIPNYCSNYFNIITAPLPTVGLAAYSTGKYILIFSTFLKIPFGCRIWFFVFVRWGFLCFGKGEDYLHFWNFLQNF